MSGTSLDGVDAAVIETDGERILDFGPTFYRPYKDEERALLRHALAERLKPATVETADQAGFSADALEAQACAFLAVRSMRGLPITVSTTSGAPRPMHGGVMVRP